MAAITIRQLSEQVKQKLRVRAAARGRSMEAEAREILVHAVNQPDQADLSWVEEVVRLGRDVGGVELGIPARDEPRDVVL